MSRAKQPKFRVGDLVCREIDLTKDLCLVIDVHNIYRFLPPDYLLLLPGGDLQEWDEDYLTLVREGWAA